VLQRLSARAPASGELSSANRESRETRANQRSEVDRAREEGRERGSPTRRSAIPACSVEPITMIWQFGERAANARNEKAASRSLCERSTMIRLKGSPGRFASASAAVDARSVSNRGRKLTAITAVTPGHDQRRVVSSVQRVAYLPPQCPRLVARSWRASNPALPGGVK